MKGVLVDTSLWVDHFQRENASLAYLLAEGLAMTHPMVLGELTCGTPRVPRAQTLSTIALLDLTEQASFEEVTNFIERETLYGMGCGWVDMVLLTSTLLTPGTQLWTLDRRLASLAQRFGVSHHYLH